MSTRIWHWVHPEGRLHPLTPHTQGQEFHTTDLEKVNCTICLARVQDYCRQRTSQLIAQRERDERARLAGIEHPRGDAGRLATHGSLDYAAAAVAGGLTIAGPDNQIGGRLVAEPGVLVKAEHSEACKAARDSGLMDPGWCIGGCTYTVHRLVKGPVAGNGPEPECQGAGVVAPEDSVTQSEAWRWVNGLHRSEHRAE